jgi:sulfopyruvate decarboxylase TPP-binding subunit
MLTAVFDGRQMTELFARLGITHVVTVPDSTIGPWEREIAASDSVALISVCREGEAWAVAAGLQIGGAVPLVAIQCTGLFESGDSLRNVVHDLGVPLFALVGYRSYLSQDLLPGDTCLVFTEPILEAWRIDYRFIDSADKLGLFAEHFRACRAAGRAGAILLAEGKS